MSDTESWLDDGTSEASALDNAEKYLAWFEARRGPQKRAWPGLVGDIPERAAAIVRFGSPYFVVIQPFKKSVKANAELEESFKWEHPLRVVLKLDKDGYVAKTPRVG